MRRMLILTAAAVLLGAATVAGYTSSQAASGDPAAIQAIEPAVGPEAPVSVPPPSDKAVRYYRSGNLLWFVDLAWGLTVPFLFLFTGFSARIRDWSRKLGRKWFFVVGIYCLLFIVINFIINLPLAYYEGFVREHSYGLSSQTAAKWMGDSLKSLAVGVAGGVLFLWVPYWLLRASPRRWWFYTTLFSVPLMVFIMLIAPIWIDPLFNDFGPMKDKILESKILALADRAGIEGSRVFEVDKSVDTTAVNAYVTGFWKTKRIVLWDTILAKLSERELLVVVAHEMGHYVLKHIVKDIVFASFLILTALYAADRLGAAAIRRFKDRFGFEQLSDVASLPLFLLLIGVISFALSPIALAFSRYQEHEADRFALEITRDNHDAATAFVKLQEENLGVPRPGLLYTIWRASHPSIGDRIDFCNSYHPWLTGQPLKYAERFRKAP